MSPEHFQFVGFETTKFNKNNNNKKKRKNDSYVGYFISNLCEFNASNNSNQKWKERKRNESLYNHFMS